MSTPRLCHALLGLLLTSSSLYAEPLMLQARTQVETSPGSGRYHQLLKTARWDPSQTAVIVCDVWDTHHSRNAALRVEELAPRLDALLTDARRRGMTVIHSPSDCMDAYRGRPARSRAMDAPGSKLPDDIRSWCSRIPAEERAVYPLDQSDGGADDDPKELVKFARQLKAMGRSPGTPWKSQNERITIDAERDYISDRGDEVWNVLQQRGIKNVLLTGVHTNMCVLGRPFGLRQMARNGMNVILVRDLTDTMYNPARWPYVSHFTGTDLIVSHIERFVCPTITSDQLLGGKPFRFRADKRPHAAIVIGEQEYETNQTLPRFALEALGRDFRVTLIHASDNERNDFPGLQALKAADVALFSVRRRTLPAAQLQIVREFVAAGKPVLGIRTASHAFCLRNKPAPEGLSDWPEFDAQVFGGSYTNHYGNLLRATVQTAGGDHPILTGLDKQPFAQGGSLYKTAPLAAGAKLLLTGAVEGHPTEPVAWTFERKDGGRSFYTSMGHRDDFDNPQFVRLLANALHWAAGIDPPQDLESALKRHRSRNWTRRWTLMPVPSAWTKATDGALSSHSQPAWYRCAIRVPADSIKDRLQLRLGAVPSKPTAWFNGRLLKLNADDGSQTVDIPRDWIDLDDANLLVIRLDVSPADRGLREAPSVKFDDRTVKLEGRWQFRLGEEPGWANIPLPARYGASTDILFEP